MTTSKQLIDHGKSSLAMIREDYLHICKDAPHSHCAAVILSVFEYWTGVKTAMHPQHQPWVWKTYSEIRQDILGLFGASTIRKSTEWLVETGYLKRRNNPKNPWDKRYQYLFATAAIQKVVAETLEVLYITDRSVKDNQSESHQQRIEDVPAQVRSVTSNISLSESTTESTIAEITESESTNREGGVIGSPQIEDLQAAPPTETFDDFLNTLLEVCQKSIFDWNRKKYRPIAQAYWDKHYRIQHLEYVDQFVKDGRYHFSDINPEQVGDIFDEATQIYGEGQPDDTGLFDTTLESDDLPAPKQEPEWETTFDTAWQGLQGQYQASNRAAYENWIADTQFVSCTDDTLTLLTRNHYAQEWIANRMGQSILRNYQKYRIGSAYPTPLQIDTLQVACSGSESIIVQAAGMEVKPVARIEQPSMQVESQLAVV